MIRFFTIVFFCVGSFSLASSGEGDINIKFRGQLVSAEVISAPLRLILEKLNRERGIWFQASEDVLDTEVSVRFKSLSVEEGIKRILSRVSYALFLDQNEKPLGVFIVSKGKSNFSLPKTADMHGGETGSTPLEQKPGVFPSPQGQ